MNLISKERLAEIASIPDEAIDTSDIPEPDEGWFKRARLIARLRHVHKTLNPPPKTERPPPPRAQLPSSKR